MTAWISEDQIRYGRPGSFPDVFLSGNDADSDKSDGQEEK